MIAEARSPPSAAPRRRIPASGKPAARRVVDTVGRCSMRLGFGGIVFLGAVLALGACRAEVNAPAQRTGTKTVTVEPPAPAAPLSDRDRLSASPRHHEWKDVQY